MIRINQILHTPENCLYQIVTAALCPSSDQQAKSTLNRALVITEIRDYPSETDVLTMGTKASTNVLTNLQSGAKLQSP